MTITGTDIERILHEPSVSKSSAFAPGLDQFLRDKSIGPLTGLSKRFAELHLNEEPYKLPEALRQKMFYAMTACYMLRGETQMVNELMEDTRNPLDPLLLLELEGSVCEPGPNDQNRFVTLIYDHARMKEERKDIERDMRIEKRRRSVRERNLLQSRNLGDVSRITRESRYYHTLRRALGYSLADGSISGAMAYSHMLKHFPHREHYEHHRHTRAVIDYLENGGEKTLRKAAGFRFGTNENWWRIHKEDFLNFKHEVVLDMKVNWASNAVYSAVGGATMAVFYWALHNYAPAEHMARQLGVLGK